MATSVVQVCNQALAHLGTTKQIASLVEQSKEARACNLMYEKVRDSLLRRHWWSFNNAWTTVGALTNTHPWWQYAYQYPSDCLGVRYVANAAHNPLMWKKADRIPHQVGYDSGARVILTNEENAVIVYSARVVDPNVWDVGFADALGWSLAVAMAMPLSGRAQVQNAVIQGWNVTLSSALAADGNEDHTSLEHEPDWLTARLG